MGKTYRARANAVHKRSRELAGPERVAVQIRRIGGHSIDWQCTEPDERGDVVWTVKATAPDGERLEVTRSGNRASNAPLRRALASMLIEVKRHPRIAS